jgi:hypothetical protein
MLPSVTAIRSAFSPEEGQVVLSPPSKGRGNWIGAPAILFDGKFYLAYRTRDPGRRGGKLSIGESPDGTSFCTVWETDKEEWDAESLERAAIAKVGPSEYRLYVSLEDRKERRWRLEMLSAESPSSFDVGGRRLIIHPEDVGKLYVKDPYIYRQGEKTYLYLHCLSTALVKTTAVLTSVDGIHFTFEKEALEPGEGWDAHCPRITSIISKGGSYLAFYDGAETAEENQEEKTGLAVSDDLLTWRKADTVAPAFFSPNSTGSLRYVEAYQEGEALYLWYEYARRDGSHELRMVKTRY